jgi:hypothetical protein
MVVAKEFTENTGRETCDVCGRLMAVASLVFSEDFPGFLCDYCRAEETSCGCGDDVS